MSAATFHRLDGLEPDNLLAFLALLGVQRTLDTVDQNLPRDEKLWPRVAWDIDQPPLRPRLFLARLVSQEKVLQSVAMGLDTLATFHDFAGRKDLNYTREECREILDREARSSSITDRRRVDLFSALMSDGAIKDDKKETVDSTPLCLLFGQGHQHFLDRLAEVPNQPAPPSRGKGKKAVAVTPEECLAEALFQPWHRADPTSAFRWDPEEDVRYALMAGDPTDAAYKSGAQHGANRLAAIGFDVLAVAPKQRRGRTRPYVIGGKVDADGFSFAWPIWPYPASLAAIRALLAHADLRKPGALGHLGVEYVMIARRLSVGKFMNFGRARPLEVEPQDAVE